MTYEKVNMEEWARKEHFEIFRTVGQCTFSQTTNINITGLQTYLKNQNIKFYPTIIYLIAKSVNKFSEFRMRMKDDELVAWNEIHPSYTIFHSESETFSSLWSPYKKEFTNFLEEYSLDIKKYGKNKSYLPKEFVENIFYISANPWLSFTSFNLNVANMNDFFAPMFTIGKYYSDGTEVFVPIALQVHHAVCDGYHAGRVLNELQEMCYNFEKELT